MIKWIFKLTILFIISIICSQVNSNSIPDSLIVKKLLEEKNAFLEENQYEEAIEKLIEATSIYQKNSQWAKVVNGFNEAALLSDNTSNELAKANYIEQATVLAQKHLDENHFEVGILNQRKGELFITIEKYDSANYFFNKAIEILKHNQKWEDCAWANITLAVSH